MSRAPRVAHVATVDLTHRFLLLGQLRRLRDEGFEVAVISAPGPWVEDLEAEGLRHIPWPHATRSWSLWDDVRAFVELVGILRRERFDLVHTHNPKPGVIGRIAAGLVRVPCVMNTVHGFYATPNDPPAKRYPVVALEWLAARFSDLELYQSEEDLEWARRIRLAGPAKAVMLGNGTDLSAFYPSAVSAERLAALREQLGIEVGAPVVGTVGRLVAEKGYRELFEAARRVRAEVPDVRFLAVGSVDTGKSDVISEAEIGRAAGDVLVTGWREDVRDLLGLFDVFVLPSWREGMPRSAIEAAAMARPLVLTDIRGCREVARDAVEGILVPPRNPGRLAEAILRLLRDPSLRVRMGEAARERAVLRFDERRVAEIVLERSRSLLRRRGLATRSGGPRRIRRARPGDAAAIARIHREALPDAFLPSLGDRFLRRLYRGMASDPRAVALVAENGQGVVGFAAGVPSVGDFYRRFFVRHGIPAAVAAVPHALRPGTMRKVRESATYPDGTAALPESELLSIAVDPAVRSKGIGRVLAQGVVSGLAEVGAREVKVVVGADNEGANRFYEHLGFREAARIKVHGDPSNVWVIRCTS